MELPAPESLGPNEFQSILAYLRALLRDLPLQLPIGHLGTSKYTTFLAFDLDVDLLDRTGSEAGALNEQLKGIFGWKTRTTGDGTLHIEERGAPIAAVKDGNVYAWWDTLKFHPHARVLAILAMKIFALLVNSMPDERTNSTLTWLNSPLRSSQNAQTLVNLIQVCQWYKAHNDSSATNKKPPYRPAVKFRDVDKDLLNAVALGEHGKSAVLGGEVSVAVGSDSEEEDCELEDDELEMTLSATRLRLDGLSEGIVDLQADEDIPLDSAILRDFLTLEPTITVSTQKASTSRDDTAICNNAEPDWDF